MVEGTHVGQNERIMGRSTNFVDFRTKVNTTTSLNIKNTFAARELVAHAAYDKKMNNAC